MKSLELVIAHTDNGRWQAQVRKTHLNFFGCKVESTTNIGEPKVFADKAVETLMDWADLYLHE